MTGAYDQKPMKSSLMEIGRDQERQELPIGFKIKNRQLLQTEGTIRSHRERHLTREGRK